MEVRQLNTLIRAAQFQSFSKAAESLGYSQSAVTVQIKALEEAYAKAECPVVSNNSAHRWTPDVPMVVPEINPEHYEVIEHQKKRLGTTHGFIAVKPNCSIQAYTPALAAWKEFEPHEVIVSTYLSLIHISEPTRPY